MELHCPEFVNPQFACPSQTSHHWAKKKVLSYISRTSRNQSSQILLWKSTC